MSDFSSDGSTHTDTHLTEDEGSSSLTSDTPPRAQHNTEPDGGTENSNFLSSSREGVDIITSTSSDVNRRPVVGSQGAELTTHSTFDPNRSQSSNDGGGGGGHPAGSSTIERGAGASLRSVRNSQSLTETIDNVDHHQRRRSDPAGGSAGERLQTNHHGDVSSHNNNLNRNDSHPIGLTQIIRHKTYALFFPKDPDQDTQLLAPTVYGGHSSSRGDEATRDSRFRSGDRRAAHELQTVDFRECNLGSGYDDFVVDIRDHYSAAEDLEVEQAAQRAEERSPRDPHTTTTHDITTHGTTTTTTTTTTQGTTTTPRGGTTTTPRGTTTQNTPHGPWWRNVPNYAPEVILRDESGRDSFLNYLQNVYTRSAPSGRAFHRLDSLDDRKSE